MSDHQRVIASARARIGAILGLRTAVTLLSAWLLIWGATVLVLRAALLVPREPLLWGLLGVACSVIVGVVVGIRRRPSIDTVRAMLDCHWQCGGLLMATSDADTSNWPIEVPASARPTVRWRGGRSCGILLCSAAFLLACFLIPSRYLDEFGSQRLVVGAEVEKLAEKVALLKEEKILPPERAKSLELALEQLEQDASGNDPAKTWEAMDHLEQSVAQASAEAAEEAARDAEKAARAEELAAALDRGQSEMGSSELSEAMRSLAEDVKRAAEDDPLMAEALLEELQKQIEEGLLSAEQLAELAESLGKCKACELGKLRKLAAARLIDPALLKQCEGNCKLDPDELAVLLCKCKGSSELALCLAGCKPGRGGVNRGRGDAPMTWTDENNRDDVAFQEKVLPPGAVASLNDSRLQGVSISDPTAAQPSESSAGGALDVSTAGRGSARTQVILPEHRKVIQRFFAREPVGKSKTPANP